MVIFFIIFCSFLHKQGLKEVAASRLNFSRRCDLYSMTTNHFSDHETADVSSFVGSAVGCIVKIEDN